MLGHVTETLHLRITNFYISTGLLGIVLCMAIESCCIPLPSEIVMPVAGIMLMQHHLPMVDGINYWLALLLIGLSGAVGCLLGSIAAYAIGSTGGRPLLLKYGRYVLISQHDADKADAFFLRWGSATAFFSRLLPVVRTYISLPAGIAKMPFGKFCLYSFLGSFPWCFALAYVGTILGENLSALSNALHGLDIVILLLIVVLVVLYLWRHIRNDRKARTEQKVAALLAEQTAQPGWRQPIQSQQNWGGPAQQPSQFQPPQQPQQPF